MCVYGVRVTAASNSTAMSGYVSGDVSNMSFAFKPFQTLVVC